jgi:hypothetical protein
MNAVQELIEEFGFSPEEAEAVARLEEVGFVFDQDGAILPDIDPDEPIGLEPATEQAAAGWN